MKMSLRWLAVALFLTTLSVPRTLKAAVESPDGNPIGPPPIVFPPSHPADGNPTAPPPTVAVEQFLGR